MMTSWPFSHYTPEWNIVNVKWNWLSKLIISEQEGWVSPEQQKENDFNDALISKFWPNALDETALEIDDILKTN